MEYYGYAGQILHVDLTSGYIHKEPLDLGLAQKFLGGHGLNYRLEHDLLRPGTDPLSADNPIIIGVGPLVSTLAPQASKCVVTMKSTIVADRDERKHIVTPGNAGTRRFGQMIKNAGYDHVVITGRAKKPSYLKIIDDDIEICDASNLWGKKDIYQTTDELSNRHRGKTGKAGVWAIGRAGENLVTTAIPLADKHSTFGRWGCGAVLGSKNLKAVVSLGTKGIRVADPKRFKVLVDKKRQEFLSHPSWRKGYPPEAKTGSTPTRKSPYPPELFYTTLDRTNACMSCIDPCKFTHVVREGRFAGDSLQTNIFLMLGADQVPFLKLPHYGDIIKLLDVLNRVGIGHFTGVRMLNFVTKLYERGVISVKDTGGLVLKTGDIDAYLQLIKKWVDRQDIGNFMAEGWLVLSDKVGVEASTDFEDGAAIVRGNDILHDPRFMRFSPQDGVAAMVRSRAHHVEQSTYSPVGEDIHQDTYWPGWQRSLKDIKRDAEEKMFVSREAIDRIFTAEDFNFGRLEKHAEDVESVYNSLGICLHAHCANWKPMYDIPFISELYTATTGFEVTPRELKIFGDRINTMERLVNIREGFTRKDHNVPALWLQHTEKPMKLDIDYYATDWFGRRVTKEDMYRWIDDYYDESGYDIKMGIPTREKLKELELEEFAEIIKPYLT